MALEDHVGDIISKARKSANIPSQTVAEAGGISLGDLESLEASGVSVKAPDYQAIACAVGLHEKKLETIAKGWEPKVLPLETWTHLRQITSFGMDMNVHSYLVWDEATREAALFDTGFDTRAIFDLFTTQQLHLQHLFLTHTHHDHIACLGAVREKIPTIQLRSNSKHAPPKQRIRGGETFKLGRFTIETRDTPGHAEDGLTFIIKGWPDDAPMVAIVGDAIFAGSMGGAPEHGDLAKKKVREHILCLPEETLICPGHGPLTTVGQEKEFNPFFL